MQAVVFETGMECARVVKVAPFGLSQAALQAIEAWRYQPALRDGEPIAVMFFVTTTFDLK